MFLHCSFLFLYSCCLVFIRWEDSSSFSCASYFYQYISLSFSIKKQCIFHIPTHSLTLQTCQKPLYTIHPSIIKRSRETSIPTLSPPFSEKISNILHPCILRKNKQKKKETTRTTNYPHTTYPSKKAPSTHYPPKRDT